MESRRTIAVLLLLPPCFLLLAGCGEKQTIEVTYARPAQYPVPDNVRSIAVSPFGGATERDRRWGEVASDKLAAELQAVSREFARYELIDRKNLKSMLDEQDLQIAFGTDGDAAMRAGQAADAQAVIYGTVAVDSSNEHGTRMVFDPLSRSQREVSHLRRSCKATVTFSMNDPFTSETIATKVVTREYDSAGGESSAASKVGSAMGFGGGSNDGLTEEQALERLIDQCVREFVATISPHRERHVVALEKGKSKLVQTANKLAAAGDTDAALEMYVEAMALKADDDGAAFNAGAMHEKLGRLSEAERLYGRAFGLKDKEKYLLARRRVQEEIRRQANLGPQEAV